MPSEVAVRIATPADEGRVEALLEASYPSLMAGYYDPAVLRAALPLMTRANPALLAGGTYYLAETAERGLVACGGWTRERPDGGTISPGIGHVRHFATHAHDVGRGFGRAIYLRCARDARAAGLRYLHCYASLNAEGFYAALGFAARRRIAVPLRAGLLLPAVLMVRSL